ncbi:MAG: hypothetical protein U0871_01885 [Gemmataceae bacterium]
MDARELRAVGPTLPATDLIDHILRLRTECRALEAEVKALRVTHADAHRQPVTRDAPLDLDRHAKAVLAVLARPAAGLMTISAIAGHQRAIKDRNARDRKTVKARLVVLLDRKLVEATSASQSTWKITRKGRQIASLLGC